MFRRMERGRDDSVENKTANSPLFSVGVSSGASTFALWRVEYRYTPHPCFKHWIGSVDLRVCQKGLRESHHTGTLGFQIVTDYHAPENKFERFRVVLELMSRFEFYFRRCGILLERFDFLVCSKFNHTQCGRTCACAVACWSPQNSNSNVVVSVTIHDDTYIYNIIF